MKTKLTPTKAILTSILLSHSVAVMADDSSLKVAIIEDATGSKEIKSGAYEQGITALSALSASTNQFEKNMGLCAAYLHTKSIEITEPICTAAIRSATSLKASNTKAKYYQSLSYSNRGISKYLNNDMTGAIQDLAAAKAINNNTITRNNFAFIEMKLAETADTYAETIAD